jgi:hypothetical protein
MNSALLKLFNQIGLKMDWSCRKSFIIWVTTPLLAVGAIILALLFLNPQCCRYIYIFQAMVTNRSGPHPWGDNGPKPPSNYTGVWYRWHWNGQLSFEEHYKNGQLDGPFRGWDYSGRKWLETAYRAGQYNGDYITFYESGATNTINHYFNNQAIGHWTHFYQDGKKWEEKYFSAPGVPDGDEVIWNTNGKATFRHAWLKGEPWDGRFTIQKETNWFQEQYALGTLVSSTNVGPINPGIFIPIPSTEWKH